MFVNKTNTKFHDPLQHSNINLLITPAASQSPAPPLCAEETGNAVALTELPHLKPINLQYTLLRPRMKVSVVIIPLIDHKKTVLLGTS